MGRYEDKHVIILIVSHILKNLKQIFFSRIFVGYEAPDDNVRYMNITPGMNLSSFETIQETYEEIRVTNTYLCVSSNVYFYVLVTVEHKIYILS